MCWGRQQQWRPEGRRGRRAALVRGGCGTREASAIARVREGGAGTEGSSRAALGLCIGGFRDNKVEGFFFLFFSRASGAPLRCLQSARGLFWASI